MKRLPSELRLPKLRAQVSVAPATLNDEERTLEVLFYSGASVDRFPIFDDPYTLSFSLDKGAARLERFNNGAPVIDNHNTYGSVRDIHLGVVEKAWIAEDGGHAQIRFSKRESLEPLWQDIKDGIVRNFSMGAVMHQMRDITEKGDSQKRLIATDWEPLELSVVPAGADPAAQALSEQQPELFRCSLISSAAGAPKGTNMDKIKVRLLADVEKLGSLWDIVEIDESAYDEKLHWKDIDDKEGFDARRVKLAAERSVSMDSDAKVAKRLADEAIEADKLHSGELKRIGLHYEMDELFIRAHQNKSTPLATFIELAIKKRAEIAPPPNGTIGVGADWDSAASKRERMEDALAARASGKEAPAASKSYERFGFVDAALACLSFYGRDRGLDARLHADRIIELSLHTTSDFPLLLGNVMNKMMLPAYQLAEPNFKKIAARREFNDFRGHHFFRPGDFPVPLKVDEHGEYKYGTMTENRESVTPYTYGRIIGFTRQALINDDLGALNDLGTMAGRRVAAFENFTFMTNVILAASGLGPTLSDSVAVYNAAHANIAATGVLSNITLASAFEKFRLQTSPDGLPTGIQPKYLLTGPANEALARSLLTAITPNQASQVNQFAGLLELVIDPLLSGARFYIIADPAESPQYIWGTLNGQDGFRTQTREGFEIDGVEFKISLDLGVGAVDFRSAVTGAGA